MSRKTNIASLVAIAATITATLASAGHSGALAQQGKPFEIQPLVLTQETVPVFVSNEMVQPLPPTDIRIPDSSVEEPVAATLNQLVASVQPAEQLSAEMECLAGAVYFESRGEPIAGQLAVAQVVVNRTQSRQFPSNYCGVVYQRAQFSFVKNGRMPGIKRGSPAWGRAKAIARIAHDGLWDSAAADSLYFHAKYVSPRWSRNKVARTTIKSHIFYR